MAEATLEGPKPKQKKESYFSFGDDQAPVTLPYIPSWLQQTQVMYSKLPMLHAPSGTITLFTTGLCEKLHYTPSDLEFDCSANEFFLEYKSLHDPHLKNLYHQARTVRRLIKQGFITPELKVKCSLEDFNIYHQYLKKMKLNRLNQKQKRQMDRGREEKLNQAKRKKEQPTERDKRGAAARERKAAKVKEEHERLIRYLDRDAMKRAKLLKERQLRRGIVGAHKSLQTERRKIAHIALDLQERQRKAIILQKRTEKEEGCAKRLSEQKEMNKADRERKLAAHWAKQERLRRQQMREQAAEDQRMRKEMQQKIEGRKQSALARQMKNQAEFLKIRDDRAKNCQEKELRIERALTAKMKKVCNKYEKKSALHRPVLSMSFPPIDKGFKSHVARGSIWSSVESSLQTTSLDPATGVWNYPPTKRHKVSSPSISTSSQLSTSSTVLPPIIITSDFSSVGDEQTESSSFEIYPESVHQKTDLSDTITEDSIGTSDAIAEGSVSASEAATEASSIIDEIFTALEADTETSKIEVDTVTEDGIVVTEEGIAVSDIVLEDSKAALETVTEAIPVTDSCLHAFAKTYVKQEVLGGIRRPVNLAAYDKVVHGLLDDVYREIAEENPEMVDEDAPSTDDLYLDLIAIYNDMNIHDEEEDSGSHGDYPSHGDSSRSITDVPYPIQVDEEGESLPMSISEVAEEVVRRVILSVYLYLKTTGELLPDSSVSSLQAEGTSGTRRSSTSSSGPALEETLPGSLGDKIINMESISELLEQLPSSAAELCRSSQDTPAPKRTEESDRHSSLLLMESLLDASTSRLVEEEEAEEEGSDADEGGEEVIGIVENEILSEQQSRKSIVSYGELSEVFREKEDGSLVIEGAIAEKVLDAPGQSLTEAVLSIESLHRNKSGQQTTSSSSCHLNKSTTEGDEEGSGEATGVQYHSVIPVFQTNLLSVTDELISRNLSLISSKPEGNRLAGAHQASGRNSFRNVFRPDITYCAQSLQSLQSMKKSVDKNQGELGFLEEEEELNKKDSKEKLITVEETEGVCYLPKKKTYQVTYDSPSPSIKSLNKEGEDSSPSADEKKDTEKRKKRKRKSKKRQPRNDKRDSSAESGSRTGSTQGTSVSTYSDSPRSRGSLPSAVQSQGSDTRQPTDKNEEVDKSQIERASSDSAAVSPQEKSGSVASVLDSIVTKISQLFGSKKDVSQESVRSIPSKISHRTQLMAEQDNQQQASVEMKDESDISPDDRSAKSDEHCEADIDTEGTDQMTKDTMTDVAVTLDTAKEETKVKEVSHEKFDEELHMGEETKEARMPSSLIEDKVTESVEEPAVEEAAEKSIRSLPSEEKAEESVEMPHGEEKDEESARRSPPGEEKVEEPINSLPGDEKAEESVKSPTDDERVEDSVDGPVIEEQTQRESSTAVSRLDDPSKDVTTSQTDKHIEDEIVDNTGEDNVMGKVSSKQGSETENDLHAPPRSPNISEGDVVVEPSLEGVPTKTEGSSSMSVSEVSSSQMQEDEQTDVEALPSSKNGVIESVSEERGSREQVKTSQVSVSTEQDKVIMTQEVITETPTHDIIHKPTPSRSTSSKGSSSGSVSSKKSSSHTRSSKKSSSIISTSKRSSSIQSNLKSPYSEELSKRSSTKVGSSKPSSTSKIGHSKRSSASYTSTKRPSSLGGTSKKSSLHAKSSTVVLKSLSQGAKTHFAHLANIIPSEVTQGTYTSPQSRSSPTLEQAPVRITAEASCKSSPCVIRDELPVSSFVRITSQSGASSKTSPRSKASSKVHSKTTTSSRPYLNPNKSSQSQTARNGEVVTSTSLPVAASLSDRKSKGILKSSSSVKGVQRGGVSPSRRQSSLSSRSSSRKSLISRKDSEQRPPPADASSSTPVRSDDAHTVLIDETIPVESDLTVTPKSSVESSPSIHSSPLASTKASFEASEHTSEVASVHTSPVSSVHTSPVASVHASPVASVHASPVSSDHTSKAASVHTSPVASVHTSPVASVHTSPVASVHASPVSSDHTSKAASVHTSLVASVHTSPVASVHTSPVASVHTSPVASVHTSPLASLQASPVSSSPASRKTSIQSSSVASATNSPVQSQHTYPVTSVHASPVGSVHTSPVASDHSSPVASDHTSQVTSVHTTPVASDHKTLVASDHTSPVVSLHTSPVASDHKSLVGSTHTSPVGSDHTSPVVSLHTSPVASDHTSPVASDHTSPVASVHTSPVASVHTSPVDSDHKALVGSTHTSPVASDHTSPVASDHISSVASDQKPPVDTEPQSDGHSEEIVPHLQPQKISSHAAQKKKSSLLSFFRRGSITRSRSDTSEGSDVMKIVQIARRTMSDRSRRSLLSRAPSHGHGVTQEEHLTHPTDGLDRDNKIDKEVSSEADPGKLETTRPPSGNSSSKTSSKSSLKKQRSNHSQASLSSNTSMSSKTSRRSSHTSLTSKTSKTSRTSRRSNSSSLSKRTSDRSKTSVTSNGSKKGMRSRKSSRSSVYEVVEE